MDRKEGGAMPFPWESWAPSNTVWPEPTINIYLHTAAWIKMPLGTVVGFGPDNIPLNEDPAPLLKKGGSRWYLAWEWALVQATLS